MLKNKKGFTLVEVIVVLVILAILAALMVPAMTGWIDKAKDKSDLVECRSVLLAAQTIASEGYATNKAATALTAAQLTEAETLAQVGTGSITSVTISGGAVTAITYTAASGSTWNYASKAWTKA